MHVPAPASLKSCLSTPRAVAFDWSQRCCNDSRGSNRKPSIMRHLCAACCSCSHALQIGLVPPCTTTLILRAATHLLLYESHDALTVWVMRFISFLTRSQLHRELSSCLVLHRELSSCLVGSSRLHGEGDGASLHLGVEVRGELRRHRLQQYAYEHHGAALSVRMLLQ